MNDLLERLHSVRHRIQKACISAGRSSDAVSLLAVSKKHPASKILALHQLGVTAFGENQLQEALDKQSKLEGIDIQWHYVGVIQSNKTRAIAENFRWVQSVDRDKILKRLSLQRPDKLGLLDICLQVNIDREPQKAGASPEDILQLAALAKGLENIRLRGLMAIPRFSADPEQQHDSFRRVRTLFDELKDSGHVVDTLSMGMSADLETAIHEGSTMVRIGTDLLGKRDT